MSLAERKKIEQTGKRKADSISILKDDTDDTCLDHVFGSVAKVEILWYMARYLLTTQRATMTPIVFETVLFLKFNNGLWDEKIEQKAYAIVIWEQKEKRLADKLKLAESQEENIECTIEASLLENEEM